MHILLCGKQNTMLEQLVKRLNKEQHDVYLLDGQTKTRNTVPGVFQQYHFEYVGEGCAKSVTSASPECMVIFGACDSLYTWQNVERDAAQFTASLASLLMTAERNGVKRVIYLSTIDVFELNREAEIEAATIPLAETAQLQAYCKAERLCEPFGKERMEVTVVRLPEVFGGCEERTGGNIALKMTMDCIIDGKIPCMVGVQHSLMYSADAVDIIYKIISCPSEILLPIYQFRGHRITEEALASMIQRKGWHESTVVDHMTGCDTDYPPERISESHEERIRFEQRYSISDGLDLLYKDCLRYRKQEKGKESKDHFVLPILEAIVIAIVVHFASLGLQKTWVGDSISLHILYVLLFGCCYGADHGLFAALLAALSQLVVQSQERPVMELLTSYGFFLQFLELILVGVISGFMRNKFKRRNETVTEENRFLNAELTDVTRINDVNTYIKNVYEKRLKNYENSLARIYEVSTQLDFMMSQKVIFQTVNVVTELTDMNDVAIYVGSESSSYFRLAAYSSRRAAGCGNSIRLSEGTFLYDAISNGQIYQNRKMENGLPVYAAAVRSDEHIIALILTWTDDLNKINLYESNLLALLCRLVEKSIRRATVYEEAYRTKNYIENTRIMNEEAFTNILDIYKSGADNSLMEYTHLVVDMNGKSMEDVQKFVRETDEIGFLDGKLHIILSNTNEQDAKIVIGRMESNSIQSEIVETRCLLR